MSFQAPLFETDGEREAEIYIVKFKEESNKRAILELLLAQHSNGFEIKHRYDESNCFNGFAAKLSEKVLNAIRNHEDVEYITDSPFGYAEPPVRVVGSEEPTANELSAESQDAKILVGPTWGQHRISHPFAAKYPYSFDYPHQAGSGAVAYVLDSGVYVDHQDFEGRASNGKTYARDFIDREGHGTHVAGTIIGLSVGVAKKAHVVSVKVINDAGKYASSDFVAGIDWAVKHAQTHGGASQAIINASLSFPKLKSVDEAVQSAVTKGKVIFVASAGNDGKNAFNVSPAGAPFAFTVGATDLKSDARASYSNWGEAVQIYAPGSDVVSLGTSSPTALATMSGTSMAAPHVSGALALFMSAPNWGNFVVNSSAQAVGVRVPQVQNA